MYDIEKYIYVHLLLQKGVPCLLLRGKVDGFVERVAQRLEH